MKNLILIILFFYLGCASERWIQVEKALVKLVDIEEFYRYGGDEGCLLYWEDQRTGIKYVQFVKQEDCFLYKIGTIESILIRK